MSENPTPRSPSTCYTDPTSAAVVWESRRGERSTASEAQQPCERTRVSDKLAIRLEDGWSRTCATRDDSGKPLRSERARRSASDSTANAEFGAEADDKAYTSQGCQRRIEERSKCTPVAELRENESQFVCSADQEQRREGESSAKGTAHQYHVA